VEQREAKTREEEQSGYVDDSFGFDCFANKANAKQPTTHTNTNTHTHIGRDFLRSFFFG